MPKRPDDECVLLCIFYLYFKYFGVLTRGDLFIFVVLTSLASMPSGLSACPEVYTCEHCSPSVNNSN